MIKFGYAETDITPEKSIELMGFNREDNWSKGVLKPLGTIGRHSLLITRQFGSMVWLGCVLCDAEIEPDDMTEDICTHCNRCVQVCPVNALENEEINQAICWENVFGNDDKTKA